MTNSASLNMLLTQKQAKLQSFEQQRQAVETELSNYNSEAASAEITVGEKQMSLSEAVVTLSNFTIPDIIDEPDRTAFTSFDDATGEEVFDSEGFEAANAAYQQSVREHDEAVRQKEELERAVEQRTQEVAGAEADYSALLQTAQDKENELAAIDGDMDISMGEIEDLNNQIRALESQEAQEPEETDEVNEVDETADVDDDEVTEEEPEDEFQEIAVQNNKGWNYYAEMELEAELGRKPTPQEIAERSDEIKQRNIDSGNVNARGDLVVGKDKTVLIKGDVDTEGLQTGEDALQAYKNGQEYLAQQELEMQAEQEAEQAKIDTEIQEKMEMNRESAEEGLRSELSNLTQEELEHIQNAEDMDDEAIDDAIGELLGDVGKIASLEAEYGQDVGKLLGRLAKKYGYKNSQKIIGRLCNTVATSAGRAVPFANTAIAGYGVYKVANGDMSGLYDIADVAISYIPVVGTAYSLIGTENMVKFGEFYLKELSKVDDRLQSQKIINNCGNDFLQGWATAGLWSK